MPAVKDLLLSSSATFLHKAFHPQHRNIPTVKVNMYICMQFFILSRDQFYTMSNHQSCTSHPTMFLTVLQDKMRVFTSVYQFNVTFSLCPCNRWITYCIPQEKWASWTQCFLPIFSCGETFTSSRHFRFFKCSWIYYIWARAMAPERDPVFASRFCFLSHTLTHLKDKSAFFPLRASFN